MQFSERTLESLNSFALTDRRTIDAPSLSRSISLQITLEQTTPITCHEQCDVTHGCTGPHAFECRRCRHLRRMPGHECVAECEADSYVNPASRTCHKCSIPCAQCKGGDVSKDCLSCLPGWLMLEGEGVCVGSCPPGYFLFEGLTQSFTIDLSIYM